MSSAKPDPDGCLTKLGRNLSLSLFNSHKVEVSCVKLQLHFRQ